MSFNYFTISLISIKKFKNILLLKHINGTGIIILATQTNICHTATWTEDADLIMENSLSNIGTCFSGNSDLSKEPLESSKEPLVGD